MTSEANPTEFELKIIANVREHGCQVNFIFDPEGDRPSFAYSIGFPETVGQPEVIVFGLPMELMNFMINQTLVQCRDGLILDDWVEVDGLLNGHKCVLREVCPEFIIPDYLNSAMWYHRRQSGEPLPGAMQLVWPSSLDGIFPWESGCAEDVRRLQPSLYVRKLD